METKTALAALSALSHESRLAAFRQLVQAGPPGMSVGELRERLDVPAATLTAHLNILRAAALVRADALVTSVLCHGALLAAELLDLPVVVLGLAAHLWDYAAGGGEEHAGSA